MPGEGARRRVPGSRRERQDKRCGGSGEGGSPRRRPAGGDATERDIPLNGYGSTTFRREAKERGLEPDECYVLGGELRDVPDLALEIAVTAGGLDKLPIYAGLGVREVWFFEDESVRLFQLVGGADQSIAASELVPGWTWRSSSGSPRALTSTRRSASTATSCAPADPRGPRRNRCVPLPAGEARAPRVGGGGAMPGRFQRRRGSAGRWPRFLQKAAAMATTMKEASAADQPGPWIYRFDQLGEVEERCPTWDDVKALLGGKGANLAEMTRIGLPVPPGFVVTSAACRAFLERGDVPAGLWAEQQAAIAELERAAGRRFGDAANPLLVSCRSGAKFSMPGMMDTVLNIGLNDETAAGLARLSGDERFAWDAYRRLVQMFGRVVMGVADEPFEAVLREARTRHGVDNDADLPANELREITAMFRAIVQRSAGRPFPTAPGEQLRQATEAVFRSWQGKRAQDYRRAAGIPDDLGTAVNIVAMVFGNLGEGSATGVATTRNVSTGENQLEGDYLLNAQGEDVVAGTRAVKPIAELAREMPAAHAELARIAGLLERHYRETQDIEFTVERDRLWMLQTHDTKHTARAAVRIAVELAHEGLITRAEAVQRVKPDHVDFFLHPQLDPAAVKRARGEGRLVATGLNVSPGAAVGELAFDADRAEEWARAGRDVVMLRAETKPDDVHGMLAARGIITSRGGRTSHAALVARQFGKPAVVGVLAMEVHQEERTAVVKRAGTTIATLREGDWVSLDGTTGEVFVGKLDTMQPTLDDPHLLELLGWADGMRRLGVWANADYPRDAVRARAMGAQGIGLCRTEHMFFETERLPLVQRLILARSEAERDEMLARLLPMQRSDFDGLFRAMDGLPVTIRLIDPPLHEFLPGHDEVSHDVTVLETRLQLRDGDADALNRELAVKRALKASIEELREENPMLGLRGVRLGIHMPALVKMQVRAIFEAACACQRDGIRVRPRIMIPLIAHTNELHLERGMLEEVARAAMTAAGQEVAYEFGTMIEIPRAAITADQIARDAEFFSFGTNDLTQTTFGISRDDAETGFLTEYLQKGILAENPFATLDERGVGRLMQTAVELGRQTRPGLDIGICGEHGGDPRSIDLCHRLGLDYVSCSPFRVPVARLAAAHAALAHGGAEVGRSKGGVADGPSVPRPGGAGPQAPSTNPLVHWELMVRDVARARAFYGRVFGWRYEAGPGYTMIESGRPPGGGMMALPPPVQSPALTVYFQVEDIDRTLREVVEAGGSVAAPRMEIPPGWFAVFVDPDGIPVGIMQMRATP